MTPRERHLRSFARGGSRVLEGPLEGSEERDGLELALAELERVLGDAARARARRPAALLEGVGVAEEVAEAVRALEAVVRERRLLAAPAREVVHESAEERRLAGADETEDPYSHGWPL